MSEQEILEKSIAKRTRHSIEEGLYGRVVASVARNQAQGTYFPKHITGEVPAWREDLTLRDVLAAIVPDNDFDTRYRMSGELNDAIN